MTYVQLLTPKYKAHDIGVFCKQFFSVADNEPRLCNSSVTLEPRQISSSTCSALPNAGLTKCKISNHCLKNIYNKIQPNLENKVDKMEKVVIVTVATFPHISKCIQH